MTKKSIKCRWQLDGSQ